MKGSTRLAPNENYARELLQLFSIGLDELHPNGSPILDLQANKVPTYSQAAVARLLSRLTVVPDLVNVQLQQSTRTKLGSANAVHFTIAADVRRPGGGS